ncbi:hypothetical protein RFI_27749 [Reticulomyxa filosa]|uniref:Transmembrane protein n=1 Tax=Reticulomyxa filosa TaxID=46433 RepID=X6M837_RETFI|nr:hypothetical protein RFI_27749 [Reticulomyxa filosa]|eukprot:ETO09627.1 hypothetical protein RFI_27749 [Reticulomyxa filosa]
MNENDIKELMKSIDEISNELKAVSETFETSTQQLNQKFKQIDQCISKTKTKTKMYNDLWSEWQEMNVQVGNGSENERSKYEKQMEEMKKDLELTKKISESISSYEQNRSYFLIGLMGNAPMKLWNEIDRAKFKTEYNRFKQHTLWVFLLFPLLQLYFHFNIFLHQIHSLYLFYYYTSLAIRENILKQNGSRIDYWWIVHHYITLFVSLLFLVNLTPTHPAVVTGGVYLIDYFMLWQGIVIVLQMRYQEKRHYVRKALAKKNAMDVRTTEVIDERPHGDFEFLVPALYITYFFQLIIAFYFAYVCCAQEFSCFYDRAQMGLLAMCWTILPIGNLSTLVKVLYRKRVIHNSTNRITHAFNKAKQSFTSIFDTKDK